MSARTFALAAALVLAACTPSAPTPQAPPRADADPYAAALAAAPAPGAWTFLGDDGTLAACFGPPNAATESQCQLSIICNGPTREIAVHAAHPLAPDELIVLSLFNTPDTLLQLTARGDATGRASAELNETAAERQPFIDLLAPTQERFGVEIAGQITIYPWHDSIARTLNECR
jgi:hypothetical protein